MVTMKNVIVSAVQTGGRAATTGSPRTSRSTSPRSKVEYTAQTDEGAADGAKSKMGWDIAANEEDEPRRARDGPRNSARAAGSARRDRPPMPAEEQSPRRPSPGRADRAAGSRCGKEPSNPRFRVFLFQLLCVLGEWDRARDQLKVLAELDAGSLALVHVYGSAVSCELLRARGLRRARGPRWCSASRSQWVALLLQALAAAAQGKGADAKALRAEALEQARRCPGTIDGKAFDWIADADSRLGPVCEAVIDGRYYWVPFERIRSIAVEPPSDLRDFVWMPANLVLANGGEAAALIPAGIRAPRPTRTRSSASRARPSGTRWPPETFHGRGQRMLATDANEYPLLDVRRIELPTARRREWSRSARGTRCSPRCSTA